MESRGVIIKGDSGGIYIKDGAVKREKKEKKKKVNNIDKGVLFLKKLPPRPHLLRLLNPPLL